MNLNEIIINYEHFHLLGVAYLVPLTQLELLTLRHERQFIMIA